MQTTSPFSDTFPCRHTVQVQGEEGVINIPFDAVAAYHGHGALAMLAVTYMGMHGALARLPGDLPRRNELSVLSGHPGPGVRDAFEFITRAATRGCYQVDTALPWARYSQDGSRSYSFVLTCREQSVRAVLRAGVLPPAFFQLLSSRRQEDAEPFRLLRRQLAHQMLDAEPEALFDYTVSDVEVPLPA
ncbi:hypothetical protein [Kerstersia gyiorum]|uniref:Formylmethanofuran dehydrogenase subunit E n=1 Tax=Kerstersia gyiorum TaxID=206506 RepID=A0A4Q7MZA7_9BURK|nr:hypothetical protein [Kerstersia gyiorum]KAB0545052.1 hypothetical protein F7P85_01795 [Kerstersia gyiorum]MCP1632320.1 hypothetical protein [Kerstersia gyiorum]MCP1635173.1 hypothetical protein [Kerstersia gyiorum]MCP1669900.1 hypothetical protein [Kerstersia gyiorum]MCP1678039.1 hypothetical protein [Kerstersia gyiorum]